MSLDGFRLANSDNSLRIAREERDAAEAKLAEIRAACAVADPVDVTDWQRGYRACSDRILAIVDRKGGAA
jgi:hypothetical protein